MLVERRGSGEQVQHDEQGRQHHHVDDIQVGEDEERLDYDVHQARDNDGVLVDFDRWPVFENHFGFDCDRPRMSFA